MTYASDPLRLRKLLLVPPELKLCQLALGILISQRGIDLRQALAHHNTTPALLELDSGILATQSTGLQDLGVILVMGQKSVCTSKVDTYNQL